MYGLPATIMYRMRERDRHSHAPNRGVDIWNAPKFVTACKRNEA